MIDRNSASQVSDHYHDDQFRDGWWVCNSCGRRQQDNHDIVLEAVEMMLLKAYWEADMDVSRFAHRVLKTLNPERF